MARKERERDRERERETDVIIKFEKVARVSKRGDQTKA